MSSYLVHDDITNWLHPDDVTTLLSLLSLVILIEDGHAAPPTIHIQNWYTSFRDFQRHIQPQLPKENFWEGVYNICVEHGWAQILGKHAIVIQAPTAPPKAQFLENIRLHQPQVWRNRSFLRKMRYTLWDMLQKHRQATVPYSTFISVFRKQQKFIFSDTILHSVYAAFHTAPNKRFLILSGLSGTGKTQLLLQFGHSYIEAHNLNPQEHLLKIAVSPDWRDPSPLLGYINPMVARSDQLRFVRGAITDFILRAHRYPLLPFFLILDEMNLARVELYFAPFLSAMETPSEPIHIHGEKGTPAGVPPQLDRWPSNLFIGGTVNMDETTHPFSDKVLDRAFTMELWDIDIQGYLDQHAPPEISPVLLQFYHALFPAHCHFGYRTLKEILLFVDNAKQIDTPNIETQLLDQAICAKILPKIRGQHSPELETALTTCIDICVQHQLPSALAKLKLMLHRLHHQGLTRFWS